MRIVFVLTNCRAVLKRLGVGAQAAGDSGYLLLWGEIMEADWQMGLWVLLHEVEWRKVQIRAAIFDFFCRA